MNHVDLAVGLWTDRPLTVLSRFNLARLTHLFLMGISVPVLFDRAALLLVSVSQVCY